MDTNLPSSPPDSGFGKAAFRKPSNDVVNRKYRRRSPVDRSSSSEGSPNGARSSIPVHSKENPAKSFDDRRRKDDRRDIDREYGRSQHGRTSDSHKHNDRHSSRSINNHSRRDDYRREKYVDEDGRKYPRLTSRSDYTSRDNEQNSRREDKHYTDKYPRGKTDSSGHRSRDRDGGTSPLEYQKNKDSSDRVGSGKRQTDSSTGVKSGELDIHRGIKHDHNDKRDYQRIVGDHRSDLSPKLESKGRHNSASRRDIPEHQQRETSRAENKELETQEYSKEEKEKHNLEYEMHKEKYSREVAEKSESRNTFTSEGQEKKPRLFSSDGSKDQSKNVSKVTTAADEKGPLNPQKTQIGVGKVTQDQEFLKDSDIDAAKVAAMKAAEQVNKNLIGTGYMTADQKKKLLWGNKKSTTVEESTHRWDTTMFSDRERQEKFNKLMGVKGEPKVEHKPKPDSQEGSGIVQAEKQNQLQLDLEKQYTAGLRRRDGRTVGLGL